MLYNILFLFKTHNVSVTGFCLLCGMSIQRQPRNAVTNVYHSYNITMSREGKRAAYPKNAGDVVTPKRAVFASGCHRPEKSRFCSRIFFCGSSVIAGGMMLVRTRRVAVSLASLDIVIL
jgi:hypothetical protein